MVCEHEYMNMVLPPLIDLSTPMMIIVNVLGHPKGVGGLTSYFLRGGGMDVFWNEPLGQSV